MMTLSDISAWSSGAGARLVVKAKDAGKKENAFTSQNVLAISSRLTILDSR